MWGADRTEHSGSRNPGSGSSLSPMSPRVALCKPTLTLTTEVRRFQKADLASLSSGCSRVTVRFSSSSAGPCSCAGWCVPSCAHGCGPRIHDSCHPSPLVAVLLSPWPMPCSNPPPTWGVGSWMNSMAHTKVSGILTSACEQEG